MSAETIRMVWAQARDAQDRPVIGASGAMPWHLPEDLAHFKAQTLGHPVIIGRNTWDSLPVRFRPFPGRTTIVVTRQPDWLSRLEASEEDISQAPLFAATSVTAALELARQHAQEKIICVAGGAQIYTELMPVATQLQVTEIDLVTRGDAFAPQISSATWRLHGETQWQTSKTGLQYRFRTYERV